MRKEINHLTMVDGFAHSYVRSLHTALNELEAISLETVAGASGFAFRLIVHKDLCPSAMSVFDWSLLEIGARNCGFQVEAFTRLWDEEELEVQRRSAAHESILSSIDQDVPVVAWDLAVPEWELITGYDTDQKQYSVLSVTGEAKTLDFEALGRREIPILSVIVPKALEKKSQDKVLKTVLRMIVDHGEGREYCERPDYTDGYHAYLVWAKALSNIQENDWASAYYLNTYGEMRRLAFGYLDTLSKDHASLKPLAGLYKGISEALAEALKVRQEASFPNPNQISTIQAYLKEAYELEKAAVLEAKRLLDQ